MIYVPTIVENTCYYYDNNNTIIKLPNNYEINQTYNAEHIALDNHYNTYYKKIVIQDNVNCIDHNNLTTDFYYRNDLDSIIIIFLFICLFIVYIPYRLASRFWKWLK